MKKILMTMLEVGFGHKMPALAVKEALEERFPGSYEVSVIDFAKEVGAEAEDRLIKNSWEVALAFPITGRLGYIFIEINRRNLSYIEILYKDFIEKGVAYLGRTKPDLVFATHPLCLYVAEKARRTLGLDYKLVAYVVDPFDGYSLWADPAADKILVASEQSEKRLVEHGVDPDRILITGFPIKKKFFELGKNAEEVSRELGLLAGKPTILVSAGGQGIGRVFSFVEAAYHLQVPINIITVAGKNQRTKRRMDRLANSGSSSTRLVSLGYVSNMNELIAASDLVVGKSGASTFMEAVLMGKPTILTEWATFNDWYIVNFATDNEIGWYCPTPISFVSTLRKLDRPGLLEEYRQRIAALGMRPGTDEVADYLSCLLGAC